MIHALLPITPLQPGSLNSVCIYTPSSSNTQYKKASFNLPGPLIIGLCNYVYIAVHVGILQPSIGGCEIAYYTFERYFP